jgi:HSP20 family protein
MATTKHTWDPFTEMLSLRDAMGQLLEGSVVRPGTLLGAATSHAFPLNIHSTADALQVEALLPGIGEEDVQVDIDRGVLTIAAQRQGWDHPEGEQWYLREFNEGRYTRSLSLPFPVDVERATSTLANGVLTLTLPKAEAARPRRIQIGGGQPQQEQRGTVQPPQEQLSAGQPPQERSTSTEGTHRRTKHAAAKV